MKHTIPLVTAILGMGVLVMGCRHKEKEVRHEYENDVDVVYVAKPPPPLIVENRYACPSEQYVWVNGYWYWSGHKYVWRKGRWVRPPRHGEYWIEPRYEKHKRGYRYVPGHWDNKPPKHYKEPKHHDKPKKHHDKHHDKKKKHRK